MLKEELKYTIMVETININKYFKKMKKKLFFVAIAITALAGCTSNEYLGDLDPTGKEIGDGAIGFNLNTAAVTRASGADAATALGNRFIVYGEKGAITNVAPTTGNLVFPNYQVNYAANTSYTTTSNTKNWEYVGYTHSAKYQANITRDPSSTADDEITASSAAQTIKYWDYSADNYIFTAVSALDADIENDRVKIQKNEYGTGNYDKGYTIKLEKSGSVGYYVYPTLNKLYFSDRQVIGKTAGSDRNAVNAYGGNVTLTFRNFVSQIRAGIYETIPGYDIKEIKFYVSDNNSDGDPDLTTSHAFGAICPNTKADEYEGTITVVYYTNSDGDLENQPKVTTDASPATDLILGNNFNNLSTSALLAKSSAQPTWDKSAGAFTEVLPQINNSTNLKLTVDYTLWNNVSLETIEVKGATAEIPAVYLQWKPNYRYTYLFKISDKTNGWTNPALGPAGLWPITFDAVEIAAADGNVEYITTVSEPSITTYAKASAVFTDNEYKTGNNIYAVVEDGSTNPILTVNTNAKLYIASLEDGAAQELTEQTVANAIANGVAGYDGGTVLTAGTLLDGYYTESSGTYTACTASTYADGTTKYYKSATKVVTDALGKKLAVIDASSSLTAVDAIAVEDSYTGVAISVKGAKFSPAAATYTRIADGTTLPVGTYYTADDGSTTETLADSKTTTSSDNYYYKTSTAGYYVFEYYRDATGGDPFVAATGTYVSGTTYYTDNTGASTVDTSTFTEGITDVTSYYIKNSSYKPAVKIYKVIKVVD